MQKKQHASTRAAWAWVAFTTLLALGLDLGSKAWAWAHLRPPLGHTVTLWDPHLELAFTLNTGTAFSVIREVEHPWIFVPIAGLAVGWAVYIAVTSPGGGRWRWVAAGLIAGGAMGNLHDRLFRIDTLGRHGVVDFIRFNYPWGGSWPTFNLADSALVVGAALLILTLKRTPST